MNRKMKIARVGIYLLLWVVLTFTLLFLYYDISTPFLPQFIATLLGTSLTALPSFYSARVLVPHFLYQKKIRRFVGAMLLTASANTVITYFVAVGLYSLLSGRHIFPSLLYVSYISAFLLIVNVIVIGISSAVQIITDRFGMEEQLHMAENEKKNAELSFLRAQINPHFLFNVLNTIYFQINKENTEARNSIEKFSEMLRYQLYECNTDMIEISKELTYIENYVAIQQLRMEAGTDLRLKLPVDIGSFKIAPLLILPLIENAFKFISHYKDPSQNKIYISIRLELDTELVVNVLNTYNPLENTNQQSNSKGLGLKNMERRLALLYPDKYLLTSTLTESTYKTTLKIKYDD